MRLEIRLESLTFTVSFHRDIECRKQALVLPKKACVFLLAESLEGQLLLHFVVLFHQSLVPTCLLIHMGLATLI